MPGSDSSAPAYTSALTWSTVNATATPIRKNNPLSHFGWAVAGHVSDKAMDDAAADRVAKATSGFLSPRVHSRMQLWDSCFEKHEPILSAHCKKDNDCFKSTALVWWLHRETWLGTPWANYSAFQVSFSDHWFFFLIYMYRIMFASVKLKEKWKIWDIFSLSNKALQAWWEL